MKTLLTIVSLMGMFWNLENFYDYREGASAKGRFYAKCDAVSKELFRVEDLYGALPDFVGMSEVENSFVVRQLLRSTLLCKTDYAPVHYDSEDHRGMDCALIYRKERLTLISSKPCHVLDSAGTVLATRDILLASFLTESGDRLDVLVNHHPSRIGGKTLPRQYAKCRMQALCDSLSSFGGTIVSIGDFNEGPGWVCRGMEDLSRVLSESLGERNIPCGSIRFNGQWELIDRCFVSVGTEARMEVLADPALSVPDTVHGGLKPRRTSQGPKYTAGVSDHYPILVMLSKFP